MNATARRWLSFAAKFVVSSLLMGYVLWKVDLSQALSQLSTMPLWCFLLATAWICVQAVVGAMRWRLIAQALGCTLDAASAVKVTWISLFFSQILPASLGADAVRVWLTHRIGINLRAAIHSVALDRIASLCIVAAMVAAALPFLSSAIGAPAMQHIGVLVAGMLVAIAGLFFGVRSLPARLAQLTPVRLVLAFAHDGRALLTTWRLAVSVVFAVVLGQVLLACATTTLAYGLAVDLDFVECLLVMPLVVILSSVPISIAGWGVRELVLVTALGLFGVSQDSALALSVSLGLAGICSGLPGGVIWLFARFSTRSNATI